MNKVLLMSALIASFGIGATSLADNVPLATTAGSVPASKPYPYWGVSKPPAPYPMAQPNTNYQGWNQPVKQFPPMYYGNGMPMQRYFVPMYPRAQAIPNYYGNQRPVRQMPSIRNPYAGQGQRLNTNPSNNFFPSFPMNNGNPFNFASPNMQTPKMSPFGNGNSFSPSNSMAKNVPTPWKNSGNWNPWSNGNNQNMPFLPKQNNTKKKAWGSVRNIWPDFYTEFTDEVWDKSTNAPFDMGRMPGGWRAPSLSSPDPVTVGDAVINQFPPIMEEMGNMLDFAN